MSITSNNTAICQADGMTTVVLHRTKVVQFDADQIILNTGGWKTVTTKGRMNEAADTFGLDYSVYQHDHAWYVTYQGETLPFDNDSIVLSRAA